MTPAEEIEYIIIKEIDEHEIDGIKYYTIKSFPEIRFMKGGFCYMVEIFKDYRENADVIKRFEELVNEVNSRKMTIENQIVDIDRKIKLHVNALTITVPIYYKECIFTSPYTVTLTNCENCIVVNG